MYNTLVSVGASLVRQKIYLKPKSGHNKDTTAMRCFCLVLHYASKS